MKKRTNIILCCTLLLIILFAIPSYSWTQANIKKLDAFYNSKLSPVIMIPGSSATENRFDELVEKLNQHANKKHSLLKVKIWDNGRISYKGKLKARDNEPIIVIGFENNRDGYNNIKKQAKMFNRAFSALQAKYKFNNFKGIGHSNGGLIYTDFLENYFDKYSQIDIKKLMTIGTPYNFNETSVINKSEMLANFIKNRNKIPTNLTVYSVAGTETYDSDSLVPESSVSAGKYIYQKQVKHFTEVTVTGSDAEHSGLPQNDEVVSLIERYILDNQPTQRQNKRQNNQASDGNIS